MHSTPGNSVMSWSLYCPRCGWEGDKEEYQPYCPRCGAPLEIRGQIPRPAPLLGEGSTPTVKIENTTYKLEYLNPTGSFKDRGAALSVHIAKLLEYKCVVEDTSGNTGLSVAAYAGRLGLRAVIHAPKTISKGKAALMKKLGADLVIHPTREQAAEAARRGSRECFYVAHTTSPIFLEGMTSIAEELRDAASKPILVPVSSGTLLLGLYRGLARLGVRPRLIAVQAVEAASLEGLVPIIWRTRAETSQLADALVVKNPPRIEEMAKAASALVVVGDPEIEHGLERLYRKGLIVEPSSAVVEAARESLGESEAIAVLTGSGLKYVD